MSLFLRNTRILGPSIFRASTLCRGKMFSNFFHPSHSPGGLTLPASEPAGPVFRRLYSSGSRFRGFNNSQTNMYVLYGLIGINCGIFTYQKYCEEQARQGNPKALFEWYRNFTVSLAGVQQEGRWWIVLTSVFSQAGMMHLVGNMVTMYYMGGLVARTPGIGPGRLLTLVIGSGLAGSAFWLVQQSTKGGPQKYHRRALGFSGAVSGVGAVAAMMYPKVTALIWGIVPLPLWALTGGYLLYDGYYLNDENSRIAHSGHLGGVLFGAAYYLLRLRGVTFPGKFY